MATVDSELMTLVNAVHQLGSSAAIIDSATEIRSLLSVLRQVYRGNVADFTGGLRPPIPMYHPFPFSIPDDTQLHVVLADLSAALSLFAQVRSMYSLDMHALHYCIYRL